MLAKDLVPGDLDARAAVALEIQKKSKVKMVSAREARLNKRRVMSDLDYTIGELGIDLSDMTKFYTLKVTISIPLLSVLPLYDLVVNYLPFCAPVNGVSLC